MVLKFIYCIKFVHIYKSETKRKVQFGKVSLAEYYSIRVIRKSIK